MWMGCSYPADLSSEKQRTETMLVDPVFQSHIHSIQITRNGTQDVPPVLFLDEQVPLTLEFDALVPETAPTVDFEIMIEACDADWRLTGEQPMSYYSGFLPDLLEPGERSRGTRIPYIHYQYSLPPAGYAFKKSGNYLLSIRERLQPDSVALQKRLIVVENRLPVEASASMAAWMSDRKSRQRIDFRVNLAGMAGMIDPLQDMRAHVLRNFRWQDADLGLKGRFFDGQVVEFMASPGEESMGGADFRLADLSSPGFAKARKPYEKDSIPYFILPKDIPNLPNRPASRYDQNGGFALGGAGLANGKYHGEYVFARFRLGMPAPVDDGKVFVTGGFCSWQLLPDNELAYDAMRREYAGDILLKQGQYDYAYAVLLGDGQVDYGQLEGDFAGTQNVYTILVYLNSPTEPGSRCVGIRQIEFR